MIYFLHTETVGESLMKIVTIFVGAVAVGVALATCSVQAVAGVVLLVAVCVTASETV